MADIVERLRAQIWMENEQYSELCRDAVAEIERLLSILGGLCSYPLCACKTEGCMVLDSPVPSVCARTDLVEEHARLEKAEEAMAEIEKITWREGNGRHDLSKALIDVRKIVKEFTSEVRT